MNREESKGGRRDKEGKGNKEEGLVERITRFPVGPLLFLLYCISFSSTFCLLLYFILFYFSSCYFYSCYFTLFSPRV